MHLKARDTTLLLASRAPLEKLLSYRQRMGWGIPWVSSGGSDFNRDIGFFYTQEELRPFLEGEIPPTVEQNARMCGTDAGGYVAEGPGLSAYALSEGAVYRTYVSTARGVEFAMAYYALLDRTAAGAPRTPRSRCGCAATTSTGRSRPRILRRAPAHLRTHRGATSRSS